MKILPNMESVTKCVQPVENHHVALIFGQRFPLVLCYLLRRNYSDPFHFRICKWYIYLLFLTRGCVRLAFAGQVPGDGVDGAGGGRPRAGGHQQAVEVLWVARPLHRGLNLHKIEPGLAELLQSSVGHLKRRGLDYVYVATVFEDAICRSWHLSLQLS